MNPISMTTSAKCGTYVAIMFNRHMIAMQYVFFIDMLLEA